MYPNNSFSKTRSSLTEKWTFLDPQAVNPELFGFDEIFAVKAKKHSQGLDVRAIKVSGWRTFAEFTNYDPKTGEELEMCEWFVFAAKGIGRRDAV